MTCRATVGFVGLVVVSVDVGYSPGALIEAASGMQDACLRSTSPETSPTRTRARSARGTKPTRTIRMHTTRHTGKSPRPSLARRQRPPRSPPTTPSRTNTTTRQLTSTPPARRARTPQAPRLTARRTRPRQISPPQTSLTRQTTPHTTTATKSTKDKADTHKSDKDDDGKSDKDDDGSGTGDDDPPITTEEEYLAKQERLADYDHGIVPKEQRTDA